MHAIHTLFPPKLAQRCAAVLAVLGGTPVAQVSAQFGICRSALYKFRHRVLIALRTALDDQPRGPKTPHNRLGTATEHQIAAYCLRHPTWSAYQVQTRFGPHAPHPRTIQRVR